MKHFYLSLACFLFSFLFLSNHSSGQTTVSEMNECEFFEYLEILSKDNYQNNEYKKLKSNFTLRSSLLKKLESYLIVFADDANYEIAPMYLQDESDKRACPAFVEQYKKAASDKKVQSARRAVQDGKEVNIRYLLIDLCDLNRFQNDSVEMYLAEFEYPYAMEFLFNDLKELYYQDPRNDSMYKKSASFADPKNHTMYKQMYKLPQLSKEQNLESISRRLDIQDNANYVYYESYSSRPDVFKGFEMYHDNDVFIIIPGMNQDRELTGGFKFSIITDYLKWRWLRAGWKRKENILTYQTISLLGNGYTPYIRYRNNFDLADSLHQYDRPFASYLCLERAKHRTWRNGLIRHRGEFQFGFMGISQGRKIQAKLHEDVITSSQFVHGWDKQIANGGRLVIQLNHKVDFLLYSNSNRYQTIFKPKHYKVNEPERSFGCKQGVSCRKYSGINLIGEADVKIGTIMTTVGGGVRFSTLDLLKQSGNQMIMSRGNSKDEFGWKIDIGLNYRYVVHNSLLEGMGLFKPFEEDPYDIVVPDNYFLQANEIERNMFILDGGISLKWRKTTVFFRQNFHTLEYRSKLADADFQSAGFSSLVASEDIDHYNSSVVPEQNSFLNQKVFGKQIYGFGTLGISWIIE